MKPLQICVVAILIYFSSAQTLSSLSSTIYKMINRRSGQIIISSEEEYGENESEYEALQAIDNFESNWLQFYKLSDINGNHEYIIQVLFSSESESGNSELVLTDSVGNPGAYVTFSAYNNNYDTNQWWIQVPDNGNWFRFQNRATQLYLEVYDGSLMINENIAVDSSNSDPWWERQQFALIQK